MVTAKLCSGPTLSAGDTAVMASSGASVDHYIAGTKVLDHASGAFAFQESTTLSSTGTLTINAFTLGGNITGNSKAITGVTYIELTTDPQVRLNVDNSFLRVSGGTDANAAGVVFHGKNSGTAGMMELFSTRADGVTVKRLEFTGGVATSVATWSNITHTGIVLSGALNANAQQITNSSIISMEAGAGLYSNVGAETSAMYIRGGPWASGGGGMLVVYGHAHASTPGALELTTTNAAGTGEVRRVIFSGAVGTSVATWSDITHTGIVLSGSLNTGGNSITGSAYTITSSSGNLTLSAAAALALSPANSIDFSKNFVAQADALQIIPWQTANTYLRLMAYDTGVGNVEVARMQGAADPYFAMGGSQEFQFTNGNKMGVFGATPVGQQLKASHNNWAALSDVVNALVNLGFIDSA